MLIELALDLSLISFLAGALVLLGNNSIIIQRKYRKDQINSCWKIRFTKNSLTYTFISITPKLIFRNKMPYFKDKYKKQNDDVPPISYVCLT